MEDWDVHVLESLFDFEAAGCGDVFQQDATEGGGNRAAETDDFFSVFGGDAEWPGIDVREGDFLLAVNGRPLALDREPWAAFAGLDNKPTLITVSEKTVIDEDAREALITPVGGESNLRYLAWVEKNRRYVVVDKQEWKLIAEGRSEKERTVALALPPGQYRRSDARSHRSRHC